MASAGVVRRYVGVGGKVVNELVRAGVDHRSVRSPASSALAPTPPAVTPAMVPSLAAGSSVEQRDAERVMLDLLGARYGWILEPARLTIPSGARVEVDGTTADRAVLVECWAHQGPPKAAQKHKVLADAFKLNWIAVTQDPRPRLILCMSDPQAAAPFVVPARSWAAQALADCGIKVEVVDLPEELRERIRAAQSRQYR